MASSPSRAAAIVTVLLLAAALPAACRAPSPDGGDGDAAVEIAGFSAAGAQRQLQVEERLAAALDAAQVDAHFRELTRAPHPAGSERTRQIAEWLRDRFQEYGLDEVRLHRYDVLLPLPREVRVEMTAPIAYTPSLREDAYDLDPDTAQDAGPTYLGMSASGDVTAPLIYAHSGNPEDYDWLESQGIDPAGKIAIVRYSVPYSYRGFKAWEAERRGVAALLVYSDPLEDGFHKGAVFPDGPWGPDSHIQRGAITYDFIVPGDPLTPGWPSLQGNRRIPVQEARSVPGIVAVPMSWRDARPLLESMGGPEVPESWRGGIEGLTYRAGGEATVRVKVDMDGQVRPIWVVEGRILGSEAPDELVVLGNHHDAWVFGGVDPSSGTATLLELARGLGRLAREGVRPRRTIVFGSWDAEEWHLTGSTEWGEDLGEELSAHAVAYINVDSSVSGPDPTFGASAVASLDRLVVETVRDVADPARGGSVLEAWREAEPADAVLGGANREVGPAAADVDRVANALGSGSDYTVFLNYLGIPVVDMSFGGEYGVYHSIYDDYWRMQNIADPGLRYMTAMAEIAGRMALRLANAQVLPYDLALYADRVGGFLDGLAEIDGVSEHLDLAATRELVALWRSEAAALGERIQVLLAGDPAPAQLAQLNQALIRAERQLLLRTQVGDERVVAEGIPDRPWFRHGLYAPRTTYAAMSLPGVTEAAEQGDWVRARHELERLGWSFEAMLDTLRQAQAAVAR